MEHAHEFKIRDDGTDRYGDLRMRIEGAVNGTRYRVDLDAGYECGEVDMGYGVPNGIADDLRAELAPLRPELTDEDYRAFAHAIYRDAKEYANDYFRESSRRYTPN